MLAIWSKMTLYPLKRLILGAQSSSQLIVLEQLAAVVGAALARCGRRWFG